MTLQELMNFEEKLLLCEYNNKFTMEFSDYIILDNFLTDVEKITNLYFHLIDQYKKHLNKENINNEKRIELLNIFNQKLLKEKINFDFTKYDNFITKYNIGEK